MKRNNERGAALILAIILIATLSVMTVSMMFLSQSEGWSTVNYRLMSQARDGAEAGVYRAANFLAGGSGGLGATQPGGFIYTPPSSAALSNFAQTGGSSPVTTTGGSPVGLYTDNIPSSSLPSGITYPTAAGFTANTQTNFNSTNGAKGSLILGSSATGITKVDYGAYAQLMSIKTIASALLCGGGGVGSLETWKITGQGTVSGVQGATVQVTTTIDRPVISCPTFAAYATSNSCAVNPAPLEISGGGLTDSYDSSTAGCNSGAIGSLPNGAAYGTSGSGSCGLSATGGSVGTNGSTDLHNSATIYGSLYEPANGASNCNTVASGLSQVVGTPQTIASAQTINYPNPLTPTPVPITTNQTISGSTGGNRCSNTAGCTATDSSGNPLPANHFRLTPTCSPAVVQCGSGSTYGNLTLTGGNTYDLCAGTYNVNSIAFANSSTVIKIHTSADSICSTSGPVYFNVMGAGIPPNGNAIDFGSGSVSNPSMGAANLQFLYAGTSQVQLNANAAPAALIYAPSADVTVNGGGTFYGAIVGSMLHMNGGASISYDRNLANTAKTPGNPTFQAFSWSKF